MCKTYAVQIGDTLWNNLYQYLDITYSNNSESNASSIYQIVGVYEEDDVKFAVIKSKENGNCFRLNFSLSENNEFSAAADLIEIASAEETQFALEDIENFEKEYKKKQEEEDKEGKSNEDKNDNNSEDDNSDSESEEDEDEDDDKKKKAKYVLEEIPEYVDLNNKYSELQTSYNTLTEENKKLSDEISELKNFKLSVERKQKEDMINNTFYMLSDEDKADVIANIDTYSLDDIEAKLSILCVRNKVNFAALDDDNNNSNVPNTFNLGSDIDDSVPAWVRAVLDTAKTLN